VTVGAGETVHADLAVPSDEFCYYDAELSYGPHGGDFTILAGTSSENAVPVITVSV
jgi:hypothetical protein